MQHALRTAMPHGVNDRYYDSRDELYNGNHSPYASTPAMASGAYGYQYSGYQYPGGEPQYPYGYGQYRAGGEHPSHPPQYSHGRGRYYAHPVSSTYSQYRYPPQAVAAAGASYAAGYATASYYSSQEYSGHSHNPNQEGAQGSDCGSLESYGENYYEGVDGNDDGAE